ncbi:hypothetical protein PV350_38665, partial [Streptomyces sp. PA03-6a]|nr:hypothetical protein [Streptomyces sp. PA03-6a]
AGTAATRRLRGRPDPATPPRRAAGERDVDRMPTGLRIVRAVGAAAGRGCRVRPSTEPTSCGRSCGCTPTRPSTRSGRAACSANTDAAVLAIAERAAGLTGTAA